MSLRSSRASDGDRSERSQRSEGQGRPKKRGTLLKKKSSLYFDPNFAPRENQNQDLRERMRRTTTNMSLLPRRSSGMKTRTGSMFNISPQKTMDRLNSMMDLAFLPEPMNAEEENPEEALKERKEKQLRDEENYWYSLQEEQMKENHEQAKAKAAQEMKDFYLETEELVNELEKSLGVDDESLARLQTQVAKILQLEAKKSSSSNSNPINKSL